MADIPPPEHYFAARPTTPTSRRLVRLALRDVQTTLTTDSGVFSPTAVDPGTVILLSGAPAPPVDGDLLDLGCGYGPIAVTLAQRWPDRTVWAVDVNERALDLTRMNATAAGCPRVRVGSPPEIPVEARFAAIYSNPPIRVGKTVLHGILLTWLPRLLPGGVAYLVIQRHLGSDSLQRWLMEQGFSTTRLLSQRSYRVLAVSPGRSEKTDAYQEER